MNEPLEKIESTPTFRSLKGMSRFHAHFLVHRSLPEPKKTPSASDVSVHLLYCGILRQVCPRGILPQRTRSQSQIRNLRLGVLQHDNSDPNELPFPLRACRIFRTKFKRLAQSEYSPIPPHWSRTLNCPSIARLLSTARGTCCGS